MECLFLFEQGLDIWGLIPDDIDLVIHTHLHNDHCEKGKAIITGFFVIMENFPPPVEITAMEMEGIRPSAILTSMRLIISCSKSGKWRIFCCHYMNRNSPASERSSEKMTMLLIQGRFNLTIDVW